MSVKNGGGRLALLSHGVQQSSHEWSHVPRVLMVICGGLGWNGQ
jgi:hypothetical protein